MSKVPAQPPSVLCLTLIHFDFFSSLPVFDSQRLVDWKWTPFLSEMNRFPVPCHVLLRTKSLSTNVTSVVSLLHMHQPLVSFQKSTPREGLSTLLTLVPERILQLHVCGLQSSPPLLLLTCGDGTRTISYWGSIPIIVVVFPDYLNLDAWVGNQRLNARCVICE